MAPPPSVAYAEVMNLTRTLVASLFAVALSSVSVAASAQSCPSGQVPCGAGCMPAGADCCGSGYCGSGKECCGGGCMPAGNVCCGSGNCPSGTTCSGGKCLSGSGGSGGSSSGSGGSSSGSGGSTSGSGGSLPDPGYVCSGQFEQDCRLDVCLDVQACKAYVEVRGQRFACASCQSVQDCVSEAAGVCAAVKSGKSSASGSDDGGGCSMRGSSMDGTADHGTALALFALVGAAGAFARRRRRPVRPPASR